MREMPIHGFSVVLALGVALGDIQLDNLQYLGCYDLSYAISRNYHEHVLDINLSKCKDVCVRRGSHRYLGIEASDNYCYCGGDIAEESVKRNTSLCDVTCPDDANRSCGGEQLMSLYDTKGPESAFNDSVLFLVGISTGIRVYNSKRILSYDVVLETASNDWAYTVDYHYAKKLVFTNTKGKIVMTGVSPSFGPVITSHSLVRHMSLSQCHGFAVDWVIDKIYWVDCIMGRKKLMRMDLDGTNDEMLIILGRDDRTVKRIEVDPYGSVLFWLADNVIETFNLTSKEFRTNISGEGINVRALALDRSAQRVYYVGSFEQSTPLFSMDYTGRNQFRMFSVPEMKSVFGLGIHGGFLYWINYAMSTDIIYKAPLEMEGGGNIKMMATIDKAVWHMRVVHPDIQAPPEVSPCSKKGCSHFCKAQSTTSAVCQCPPLHDLGDDGVTCVSSITATRLPEESASPQESSTTRVGGSTIIPTPAKTFRFGNATYIGCYGPRGYIDYSLFFKSHDISLEKCTQRCVQKKTNLAGIAVRDKKCYCGNDLATDLFKAEDSYCSEDCSDQPDSGLTCGGNWLMSVYDISEMRLDFDRSDIEDVNVTFLVGHSHSIELYNSSNPFISQTLMAIDSGYWAYSVDYHYSMNLMFTSTRRALYKTTLFPGDKTPSPPSEVIKMNGCEGFAVDWVTNQIFWADCGNGRTTIKVVNIDGGSSSSLWETSEGDIIKRMEIDPYCGLLFWVRDDIIESIMTTGQDFRTDLSSSDLEVRAISLDIQNQRLFYLGIQGSDSDLFSSDYSGNGLQTHFHLPQIDNVYGLGIMRGYVYWINYHSVDILYKAPLDFHTGGMKSLRTFSGSNVVLHMKLVDKELQMPPSSGPCSDDASSSLAHSRPKSRGKMVKTVCILVFVVVGGVMLAGLLMFLTEKKNWDRLRTSIPYFRQNERDIGGATTFNPNEDNVNLI